MSLRAYMESSDIANLRDLLLILNVSMVESSGIFPSFSKLDHMPIFVNLKIQPPSMTTQTTQHWGLQTNRHRQTHQTANRH